MATTAEDVMASCRLVGQKAVIDNPELESSVSLPYQCSSKHLTIRQGSKEMGDITMGSGDCHMRRRGSFAPLIFISVFHEGTSTPTAKVVDFVIRPRVRIYDVSISPKAKPSMNTGHGALVSQRKGRQTS